MENIGHKSAEAINVVLRDHQANAHDWLFSSLTAELHTWTERMLLYFKIQFDGVPALLVERLRKRLGHYRNDRNGFGILDEVKIDQNHVQSAPFWRVLVTLAHELIHLWQVYNGNPPSPNRRTFHNLEFRQKAFEIGFFVDKQGRTQCLPGNTLFRSLLKEHGIEVLEIFEPDSQNHKSKSSLKLYECSCGIKVRIGQSRFNAQCLDCGTPFIEQK